MAKNTTTESSEKVISTIEVVNNRTDRVYQYESDNEFGLKFAFTTNAAQLTIYQRHSKENTDDKIISVLNSNAFSIYKIERKDV